MDLRHGQVVRAIAGQRDRYQPLHTDWFSDAHHPLALAHAIAERWNLRDWYIADLDAILGEPPQRNVIESLLAAGYRLWLDVGITSLQQMNDWLTLPVQHLILASETLQGDDWAATLPHHPERTRLAFSLDLHRGTPRTQPGVFAEDDVLAIIEEVFRWGFRTLIVLDVADVGTGRGCSTTALCRSIHQRWPDLQLISGGGIRGEGEIRQLQETGVSLVMVSTWLHQQGNYSIAAMASSSMSNP